MKVLGIVGSPHTGGLTARLVSAVLAGAEAAGAQSEILQLADCALSPCRGCEGARCWDTGECAHDPGARERNRALAEADAIVFGAAVYMHGICSLAKAYIDKVRVPPNGARFGPFLPTNGKPALGITVAGGTGKGVLTAQQVIYYGFFFHCGFRGMQPMPVTRFNLQRMLQEAGPRGRGIVQAAREPAPFRAGSLGDRIAYYQAIPLANADAVDDMLYLARVLVSDLGSRRPIGEYREAYDALRRAESLLESGRKTDAADPAWKAYRIALDLWEKEGAAAKPAANPERRG